MVTQVQGAAGARQTDLLGRMGNSVQAFAAAIGRGLSRVMANVQGGPAPQFGTRYGPVQGNAVVAQVAGYRVLGDKAKGVEPGFIAKRDWTPGDSQKLLDAGDGQQTGHKFNVRAQDLIERWLRPGQLDSRPDGAALNAVLRAALESVAQADDLEQAQNAKRLLGGGQELDASSSSMGDPTIEPPTRQMLGGVIDSTTTLASHQSDDDADLLQTLSRDKSMNDAAFVQKLAAAVIRQAETQRAPNLGGDLAGAAATVSDALRASIMETEAKFTQKHYIKLDYYEEDKFAGKYQIPADKAKGGIHRLATGASARDRNEGAVREALANDLMRALGVETQKLKIVEGVHQDGTPKLMLDGTHVRGQLARDGVTTLGFHDFDGTPVDGDRYLKDGVIVRNAHRQGDPAHVFNGPPTLDLTIQELGRNKILMLLMADRDALGSRGGNKGYVGDTFVGIDPGHALETSLLARRGDVRSDFSFEQPSIFAARGYKNFSMFDQSSLSEKMEGVRQIAHLKESGADTQLFALYAAQFGQGQPDAANFSDRIGNMQRLYEGRRDDILAVFQERLAVDNFDFGQAGNPAAHGAYRDVALNLLEGLEKFTSETTLQTQSGIRLVHPQISDPSKRKEWHIAQDPQSLNVTFTFTGTSKETTKMQRDIADFLGQGGQGATLERSGTKGRTLTLTMPTALLPGIGARLSAASIANHKHPAVGQ